MVDKPGKTGDDVTVNVGEQLSEDEAEAIIEQLEKSDIQDTDRFALKELITGKDSDIMFKTELTVEQIRQITRLLTADKIARIQSKHNNEANQDSRKEMRKVVDFMTFTMMRLSVSKQRKGRFEFIESFKKAAGEARDQLMQRWLNFGQ